MVRSRTHTAAKSVRTVCASVPEPRQGGLREAKNFPSCWRAPEITNLLVAFGRKSGLFSSPLRTCAPHEQLFRGSLPAGRAANSVRCLQSVGYAEHGAWLAWGCGTEDAC